MAKGSRSVPNASGVSVVVEDDMADSERADSVASTDPPPPAVRFENGRVDSREPSRPSRFLKSLENMFLMFPEEVGKRGLSILPSKVIDWRGEERGEELVVKDERGSAEKREDTELDEECWLDRSELASVRVSDGGRRAADLAVATTGEDIGRGITVCPELGLGRAAAGDSGCKPSVSLLTRRRDAVLTDCLISAMGSMAS